MPAGDRTGPYGMGPMTGRAMGYCAGFPVPGYANFGWGRGFGRGLGLGRGFGRRARWNFMPYAAGPMAWGPYGQIYGYPMAMPPVAAIPRPWMW
jgi:hypothetical protein